MRIAIFAIVTAIVTACMVSGANAQTTSGSRDTSRAPLLHADSAIKEIAKETPHEGGWLHVYDSKTGKPVEGVTVRDSLNGRYKITDKSGVVPLDFLSSVGPFLMAEVRKPNYSPVRLRMVRADTSDLALALEEHPLSTPQLPSVVVTGRYTGRDRSFAGFDARCKNVPHAACLTEKELADHPSSRLSDMLLKSSATTARICRGAMSNCAVTVQKCTPAYFVDGFHWTTPGGSDYGVLPEIENFLGPRQIKGIEIYSGNNVPLQFSITMCGAAIVIWTK